jgi:hypothetical protein
VDCGYFTEKILFLDFDSGHLFETVLSRINIPLYQVSKSSVDMVFISACGWILAICSWLQLLLADVSGLVVVSGLVLKYRYRGIIPGIVFKKTVGVLVYHRNI